MRLKFLYFILIFIVSLNNSFAQLKKANQHYENFEYADAIILYEKLLEKNDSPEVLEKLAHSYLKIKNYSQAEKYYSLLVLKENISSFNYFNYGVVLRNNKKMEESKKYFNLYLNKAPEDKLAQLYVKSIEDMKVWLMKSQQYQVDEVKNINSVYSDFSPVFLKNNFVFVSERTKDMVNYKENSFNNRNYLNVYYTPINFIDDSMYFNVKARKFSSFINSDYHDGPVCFNDAGDIMFITRVNNEFTYSRDSNMVNRPQLYISTLKKENKWNRAKPFQYNNPKYSIAHPSISADGKRLYFSSDMPGGYGGMDLYVCEKNENEWSKPINLGNTINTPFNEVFPYIRADSVLFFSSEGHFGFGGLDIFSIDLKSTISNEVLNIGAPMNSSRDDFGIIFNKKNNRGYFSSDREGGDGNDDIYSFKVLDQFTSLQGKFLYSKFTNDPVKNSKILLMTEDGNVIKVSTTDENGFFKFENLDHDVKYMVTLDEEDPKFAGKEKFYMMDEKGNIVRVSIDKHGKKFAFQNLPVDKGQMGSMSEMDESNIAGTITIGDSQKPLTYAELNLINERGVIIQKTKTNMFGAFVFTGLPNDENFLIEISEADTKIKVGEKVTITAKGGEVVQSSIADSSKNFVFVLLRGDKNELTIMKVDDTKLNYNIKGKIVSEDKTPLTNQVVNITDNKGTVLQSSTTDKNGELNFFNISYEDDIIISIDDVDSLLNKFKKLFFMDEKGEIIKAFVSVNGKLHFTVLPTDKHKMGYIFVEDENNIAGNILFGENPTKPLVNASLKLVNSKGEIVGKTTTNAFGGFVFSGLPNDGNYAVLVDELDAPLAFGTKISITNKNGKEIHNTVIGNDGKFSFEVLNNDKNYLKLMQVEDVGLKYDIKGKLVTDKETPLADQVVNLVNDVGMVLQTSKSDKKGAITFKDVDFGQEILITIDGADSLLKTFEKLFFMDEFGHIIRAFTKINGKLTFVILPTDKNRMGNIYVDDPWLKVINLQRDTLVKTKKEILTINENIYYEFGEFKILPEAQSVLDKVVNIMKNDPQVYIEINSHTDSRSSSSFNLSLSQKRANEAVAYIVKTGISRNRISGKGLGETKLINNCSDGVECSEEEHAKNRRTEFKIKRK